jgi:hypothetical protein
LQPLDLGVVVGALRSQLLREQGHVFLLQGQLLGLFGILPQTNPRAAQCLPLRRLAPRPTPTRATHKPGLLLVRLHGRCTDMVHIQVRKVIPDTLRVQLGRRRHVNAERRCTPAAPVAWILPAQPRWRTDAVNWFPDNGKRRAASPVGHSPAGRKSGKRRGRL